jgi:solute:Na+ symporter, SSS family
VTIPKRDTELVGLVYSLTPKVARTEIAQAGDHGWYRKPVLLAGISLALTVVLNIVFG